MGRPTAFYYEDYSTSSDPEYLYHKSEADAEFRRLQQQVTQQAATISTLTGVIRAVEWCASSAGECPVCGGVSWGIRAGHGASCDIGKALENVGAEENPS